MKNLILAALLLFGPIVTKMNASDFVTSSTSNGNFSMFHGHRQGNGVGLMWSCANAAGYEIERSYDGEWFENIGQTAASATGRYRFIDSNTFPGYLHYRIKAIHEDGSTEYSETIIVRIVSKK